MKLQTFNFWKWVCLAIAATVSFINIQAQERPLTGTERMLFNLQNGMQLGPGRIKYLPSISTSPFRSGTSGEVQTSPIAQLDDELRYTYFNNAPRTVANFVPSSAPPEESIELPAKSYASQESGKFAFHGVVGATGFDQFGRRIYTINTLRGPERLLQAITELTATYTSVQVLRDQEFPRWDMRLATTSLPKEILHKILHHELDLTRPGEWMRVVRFYMQGERYLEARSELEEAIKRFPELAENAPILVELNQRLADQAFREIELRRRSGQHMFATKYLQSFPPGLMPIETELKIKDQMDELQRQLTLISELRTALTTHVQTLPEPDKAVIQPIVDEILKEIRFDSLARLNDYQRLRGDDSIPTQQKIAFAIGGWLLGQNAGLDNFAVAKSLVRVQALVREYLSPAAEPRRQEILSELDKEEGSQPELVAKILANMVPPLEVPGKLANDPEGLFRLTVDSPATNGPVEYVVQTPPEYDPYRKYPCVLALPGRGLSPEQQVDWWAGPTIPNAISRQGFAARYGYIVVSPRWMIEGQAQYNYTEVEHARILTSLRDALRRFSIDTDRVFISGHFDGGTAAWDISLSHPDLWAGALMVSPTADNFIFQTAENAALVPTYFVYGEFDATSFKSTIGRTLDQYLSRSRYDCLAVEYRGRGREHFYEELPRMIQWMELSSHRRDRSPDGEVEIKILRPGSRFHYWLEAPELEPDATTNPYVFEPKNSTFAFKIESNSNSLRISRIPARRIRVWLSPDVIDLDTPVKIIFKGSTTNVKTATADIGTMLEDVRTRADRMAPFYAKVELP